MSSIIAACGLFASLIVSQAASAAELLLFDSANCAGAYRTTYVSIADLDQLEFDNAVDAVQVRTGTWRLFRDAGYGTGNGPSVEVSPVTGQAGCMPIELVSGGAFPNDRMSSVQLLQDPDGFPARLAILYDQTGFAGSYRILTADVPDFDAIGFDNRTASIRIINGSWTFFRDAGYGAPPDRPSVTLAAGNFPDIANLPGYPQNLFPPDLMSSAQTAAVGPPPPQCPAPYQVPNGAFCRFNCAEGTQPDQASGQCVCLPGMQVYGATADGRRQCAPQVTAVACLAPYQRPENGACVPNCAPGTAFNASTGQCDCLPGLTEQAALADGRRTCAFVPGVTLQAQADQQVDGLVALGYAYGRGWESSGSSCAIDAGTVRTVAGRTLREGAFGCSVYWFLGPDLADGWVLADFQIELKNATDRTPVASDGSDEPPKASPMIWLNMVPEDYASAAVARLVSITLRGPAGHDWREAFQ